MCFGFYVGEGLDETRRDADGVLPSIAACGAYYWIYIKLLPTIGGYEFRQTILKMDGGEVAHKLVKIPKEQVASWDAEHDAAGRVRRRTVNPVVVGEK